MPDFLWSTSTTNSFAWLIPLISPSQATQVFFLDVLDKSGWKVVLCKKARAKRKVVGTKDAFINTTVGLTAPRWPTPPPIVNLVGDIELSVKENLLV